MLQLCISARFPGATEPNYRGEDNSRLGQVMKQGRVDNTCIPHVSSWVTSPGLNNSLTVGRATSACGSMGETSGGTMALKHSSAFPAVSITAWGTLEQPWRLIPMGGVKKALKK